MILWFRCVSRYCIRVPLVYFIVLIFMRNIIQWSRSFNPSQLVFPNVTRCALLWFRNVTLPIIKSIDRLFFWFLDRTRPIRLKLLASGFVVLGRITTVSKTIQGSRAWLCDCATTRRLHCLSVGIWGFSPRLGKPNVGCTYTPVGKKITILVLPIRSCKSPLVPGPKQEHHESCPGPG